MSLPVSLQPMIRADLHVHSIFSDGRHTPRELCDLAQEAGLTHMALCDHDTLSGHAPMQEAVNAVNERIARSGGHPLTLLPGVELSTGDTGTTHILGYGVEAGHTRLEEVLAECEKRRLERFQATLDRLKELGIQIPSQLIPENLEGPLGRAHVARILVKMGVVRSVGEAFGRYLAEGRPACVPYRHMTTLEAIDLLCRVGTVPVLAHPCRMNLSQPALFALVESFQEGGLQGLEVYHPSAPGDLIPILDAFARRRGLLVTGGSDFHGDRKTDELGRLPGDWQTQPQDVSALTARIT
ncbi:MAG: PHP domain-containing protein [Clostridiales bacterium]|nr:PHP domain-containing protein [Clostridiales bacterium]